jgi:hypothetical protein
VVDVLGELVTDLGADLIIALADMVVVAAKPFRSGTVSMSLVQGLDGEAHGRLP